MEVHDAAPTLQRIFFLSSELVEPAFEALSIIVGGAYSSREKESGRKAQNGAIGK
jgi:hypothetical protein